MSPGLLHHSANTDKRRNVLASIQVDTGNFLRLGNDSATKQLSVIRHTNYALVSEWSKYAMDRTIGRPSADLLIQDVMTGVRTKLKDGINDAYAQVSPGGKYLLYLDNDHFWTINLATRALANITKNASTSFVDKESDWTSPEKPTFGVAGWTKDDQAVLLYDKFDLWQICTGWLPGGEADDRGIRADTLSAPASRPAAG